MKTANSQQKRRQGSSFHLLMVPDDSSQIHRLRVRTWQLRSGILLAVGLILGLAVTTGGYLRYQGLYRKTADIRGRYAQLQQEQSRLSQRLVLLEATVSRAEKLASKVDSLVGPQVTVQAQGVGPIEGRQRQAIGDPQIFSNLNDLDPAVFAGQFGGMMEKMQARSLGVENQVTALYQKYQDQMVRLSSTPSLWPVYGWMTSRFGPRRSPFGGKARFHDGLDIAAPWGTTVKAAGDAVVKYAGYKGGLGKTVILDHGFGIQTVYGHNSKLLVKEGDTVGRGKQIAAVGNTGHSTGPHLHFEVRVDGVAVDPMTYLPPRTELTKSEVLSSKKKAL